MIEKKHKRGDVREDGMIYWAINHNKPLWLKKEKFDQYCSKKKASTTKLILNQPEINKKHKRGYVREDGFIFWGITRKKEVWLISEKFNQYYIKTKQKNKSLFDKNRDRILLANKKYRLENREKFNEVCKKWHQRNPEKHNEIIAKRRSQKKHGIISLSKEQRKIMRCFYKQADRLEKRFGLQFHVDHIIPLSKGGLHIPTNLQVLPAKLNLKKNSKNSLRWEELQLI
jgi:5-methylcytosine-specific restriction endonuclease McrA